jgi:glycine dehydrogenase
MRPESGPLGRGYADGGVGPVSGAPWGSAGILPISWAYIRMMGAQGLTRATQVAVLSANYIAHRLAEAYPVLYTGPGGLVAHECVLDLRGITKRSGVTVDDVAKRLIDYGFHAPTMSFPVAGTLMVEQVESGAVPLADSALRHAPHTAQSLVGEWDHPYTREHAVFPVPDLVSDKYWAPVGRIDGAFGDRNLVCSCVPVADYA